MGDGSPPGAHDKPRGLFAVADKPGNGFLSDALNGRDQPTSTTPPLHIVQNEFRDLPENPGIPSLPKRTRPKWWIPQTLNDALGEQIDIGELYESNHKRIIGYRQVWGSRFPIYEENGALNDFEDLRINLTAELAESLVADYPEIPLTRHLEFAGREGRKYATRILSERMKTESQFEDARIDPLTGLPNRRAFFERLDEQMKAGVPYAILFVDLDHFKSINDNPAYGHDVGDRVLIQAADRIRKTIRQGKSTMPGGTATPSDPRATDFAARFGGEEIVILISNDPNTGAATQETLAVTGNRLVEAINSKEFITHPDDPQRTLRVTASVGGAVPQPDENPMEVLDRADKNVYAAKGRGRNQYIGEESMIDQAVTENTGNLEPTAVK